MARKGQNRATVVGQRGEREAGCKCPRGSDEPTLICTRTVPSNGCGCIIQNNFLAELISNTKVGVGRREIFLCSS